MTINIYTSEPILNNKYFHIETQEKLLNVINRKKLMKIPNL